MASRRRRSRAHENPSTGAWVAIGLGVAALGVGAYFLAHSMSSSPTNANPQLPPGTPPPPPGDKWITVTIPGQPGKGLVLLSTACDAARRLRASGNITDADAWAQVCQQNGGQV
jgi:hypothetical protein